MTARATSRSRRVSFSLAPLAPAWYRTLGESSHGGTRPDPGHLPRRVRVPRGRRYSTCLVVRHLRDRPGAPARALAGRHAPLDSVSIIDVSSSPPRVVRTLLVGDEPRDIVFAGPGGNRAFITTAHRGQNSGVPLADFTTEGIGRADVWVFDVTNLGSARSEEHT